MRPEPIVQISKHGILSYLKQCASLSVLKCDPPSGVQPSLDFMHPSIPRMKVIQKYVVRVVADQSVSAARVGKGETTSAFPWRGVLSADAGAVVCA